MNKKLKAREGVTAFIMILLMAAIIIEVTIASVVVTTSFVAGVFGARLSAEALAAARAGAEDASIRILRTGKCFKESGEYPCPAQCPPDLANNAYSLTVDNRTASIAMCADDSANPTLFTIESVGTAFNRKKKIRTEIGFDTNAKEFKILSFRETPI
ncbi:MAG: hypothetical protein HYS87_02120 [Candidatus Colwellbacteria bacterium]|nr:hypothetical protein [Candidatus Colwellbacteria bacterium]